MHPHVSVLSADGAVLVSIPVSWILSLFGHDLMKINISILWFLEPYGSPLGRCGGGGALQDRQNAASLVCHSATMCLLRISTEILDCGSPLAARRTSWGCRSIIGAKGWAVRVIQPVLTGSSLGSRSWWWAVGGLCSPRGLLVRRGTVGGCSRIAQRCTCSTVLPCLECPRFLPSIRGRQSPAFATTSREGLTREGWSPAWRRDPPGEGK